jgi:hypothetical protein
MEDLLWEIRSEKEHVYGYSRKYYDNIVCSKNPKLNFLIAKAPTAPFLK